MAQPRRPQPDVRIRAGHEGRPQPRRAGLSREPGRPPHRPDTYTPLGISADYGLPPTPNASQPDARAKSLWSFRYSRAGVDTGEIVIRGGSHLDFSYIPNQAFGASLRGPDITSRWRHDQISQSVDPRHDPNAFNFYYPSRLDIHKFGGAHVVCTNLRRGCTALYQQDGVRGRSGTCGSIRRLTEANGSFGTRRRRVRGVIVAEFRLDVVEGGADQTSPRISPIMGGSSALRRSRCHDPRGC